MIDNLPCPLIATLLLPCYSYCFATPAAFLLTYCFATPAALLLSCCLATALLLSYCLLPHHSLAAYGDIPKAHFEYHTHAVHAHTKQRRVYFLDC